jgi:hypothetical protein
LILSGRNQLGRHTFVWEVPWPCSVKSVRENRPRKAAQILGRNAEVLHRIVDASNWVNMPREGRLDRPLENRLQDKQEKGFVDSTAWALN